MRVISKLALSRPMIALLAVLLTGGGASAVTDDVTVDLNVDLSSNRTEATITGTIQCTGPGGGPGGPTAGGTAGITVFIFQSVGRLLNIGIGNLGSTPLTCTGGSDAWEVTVNAIKGLKFQPGLATLLVQADTTADGTIADGTKYFGYKIHLKP